MRAAVAVLIPYAGEVGSRLELTARSAIDAKPEQVIVYGDGAVPDCPLPGVRVHHGPKMGLPATLNRARQLIQPNVTHLMWLSTGDAIEPGRISQAEPCELNGEFCSVFVRSRGAVLPGSEEWRQRIWGDNQFCLTGAIIPVATWDAIGGMDETLTYCSDWDLAMRVEHYAGWHWNQAVLAWANEYDDGLSKTADPAQRHRDRAAVVKLGLRLGRGH